MVQKNGTTEDLSCGGSLQTSIPPASLRPVAVEGRQLLLSFYPHAFQRRTTTISVRNLFLPTLPWCRVRSLACNVPALCESMLEGQDNRASGKIAFMHKLLSPVQHFAINFEILQYQYDRWLFKTITGAVNASKACGCSPNRSLENKSFSKTFCQHQNLYLIDAVRQYGYPSFFITISPYEWTFPFLPFLEEMRARYFKDVTDIPTVETLHIAHVLEQIARGYLTGGNCNRCLHKFPRPNFQELGNILLPLPVPETRDSSSSYARLGKGHFRHQSRSSSCLSALGKCTRHIYRRIHPKIRQVMPTRS